MHRDIRSALVGGVTALAFTSVTVAMAGSGIGGIFNLGQNNSVSATTRLTGGVNGAQLSLTNTSMAASATGLRITTPPNRPPLAVTSDVRVTRLNADYLDGLSANQLGRVAYKEERTAAWTEDGRSSLASVTLVAPQDGFVTLTGGSIAAYFDGCAYCAAHIRFRIDAATQSATDTSTAGTIINQTGLEQYAPLSHIVTIPVSAGTHTYDLVGSWLDVNATNVDPDTWYDTTLSAQLIPFNGAGSATPPLAATTTRQVPVRGSRVQAHR